MNVRGACSFASSLLAVFAAFAAVPACTAEQEGDPSRLGTSSQALTATNFFGDTLPDHTLALTFDDGPGDKTVALSQYLKSEGIRAGFFVNGARLHATALPNPNEVTLTANGSRILQQLLDDGHIIGNHTVTHRNMVTEVMPTGAANLIKEIAETDSDIEGYVPTGWYLFRPPYGSYNPSVFEGCKASPMQKYVGPINWDIGGVSNAYPNKAADWACWQGQLSQGNGSLVNGSGYATTAQCGDAYMKEIAAVGRGIVLMHDPYSWANGSTLDMVKRLVPQLKAASYSFVRVDEVPAIRALLPACAASCGTCSGVHEDQCLTCEAGAYLSASNRCVACTVCAVGTVETAACTQSADRQCSSCGSCDDQNACTTDSCDIASHCTHTRIEGCLAEPIDAGKPIDAAPPVKAATPVKAETSPDAGPPVDASTSDAEAEPSVDPGEGPNAPPDSAMPSTQSAPTAGARPSGCNMGSREPGGIATFVIALGAVLAARVRRHSSVA